MIRSNFLRMLRTLENMDPTMKGKTQDSVVSEMYDALGVRDPERMYNLSEMRNRNAAKVADALMPAFKNMPEEKAKANAAAHAKSIITGAFSDAKDEVTINRLKNTKRIIYAAAALTVGSWVLPVVGPVCGAGAVLAIGYGAIKHMRAEPLPESQLDASKSYTLKHDAVGNREVYDLAVEKVRAVVVSKVGKTAHNFG